MSEIGTEEGEEKQGVGLMIPSLMFPIDPDRPGWARDTAFETIEDWLAALQPMKCADFMEVDEPIGEEIPIGKGVRVYDLQLGVARLQEVLLFDHQPDWFDPGVLNSAQIGKFLDLGRHHFPIWPKVGLTVESSKVLLELAWKRNIRYQGAEIDLNDYTAEEVAAMELIAITASKSNGEQVEVEVVYKRLEQVCYGCLPDAEYPEFVWELALFAIYLRGAGITKLCLEIDPFFVFPLVRKVCHIAED